MVDCPTYVAPHGDQLGSNAGSSGPFDCTAWATSMVVDQSTCGADKFSGRSIRLASNEPVPDRGSPGLNLDQVDLAVQRLTKGAINLDVERMFPAPTAISRVLGGEPAVVQFDRSSLIHLGLGFGHTFAGGHAGKMDGVGGLHLDDPLSRRFPINTTQALAIMGSLRVDFATGWRAIGLGHSYVAFGPDSITFRWTAHIGPGVGGTARDFTLFYVKNGAISRMKRMRTKGFTVLCQPPHNYDWGAHPDQRLVVLSSGSWSRPGDLQPGEQTAIRALYARRSG